jgi:hypothetical protein
MVELDSSATLFHDIHIIAPFLGTPLLEVVIARVGSAERSVNMQAVVTALCWKSTGSGG